MVVPRGRCHTNRYYDIVCLFFGLDGRISDELSKSTSTLPILDFPDFFRKNLDKKPPAFLQGEPATPDLKTRRGYCFLTKVLPGFIGKCLGPLNISSSLHLGREVIKMTHSVNQSMRNCKQCIAIKFLCGLVVS